jgi:hypothetical protein
VACENLPTHTGELFHQEKLREKKNERTQERRERERKREDFSHLWLAFLSLA